MSIRDANVEKNYLVVSDKLAKYALDYHKSIESSLPDKKDNLLVLLRTILFYPSRFMLKYNGVKRVKDLTTHFCIMSLASKYNMDSSITEQNVHLKQVFSEFHDAGDFAKLILSITTSSFFASILYYVATLFFSSIIYNLYTSSVVVFFSFVFIIVYNYSEYYRLRSKSLKDNYFELKKEISELP